MIPEDDLIWPEFKPLWTGFQGTGGHLLVAGGYGLFLKQIWLGNRPDIRVVVPLQRWINNVPRVTRDLDIVVGLDIIASELAQKKMAETLAERQFIETEKNPRWQFEKKLDPNRAILVDLHSALPDEKQPNLTTDNIRVKHKPSLGIAGVHGRQNPEAVGNENDPFRFEIDGLKISVPNPVTWSIMKLTATRDRRRKGEDMSRTEKDREFCNEQAIKHAGDVFRIAAMITLDENERIGSCIDKIKTSAEFANAREIVGEYFGNDGWGTRVAARQWVRQDLELTRRTVETWFN